VLVFSVVLATSVLGRTKLDTVDIKGFGRNMATYSPAYCIAGHRVGKIVLGVNNAGTFGTGFMSGADWFTGQYVPSCEYPKRSNIQYLFAGAIWIGAVVGRDTLVSVGADGWQHTQEMFPEEAPLGYMIKRSIIDPSKPEYEGAISEEDYISVYTDTITMGVDPDYFGRPHKPLYIEVTDGNYAWSYAYAEDFVLFDYQIKNIGQNRLKNVYMGLYVDADVCYNCEGTNGFADDICGFRDTMRRQYGKCEYIDTVNIAWIADNEGDFSRLPSEQTPHVTATRIVRTPATKLDVSFNWWISNGSAPLDFGPREKDTVGRLKDWFRDFGTGGIGTPEGDVNKYYVLRNREFDYDQVYTYTITENDTLWQYPSNRGLAEDFADGFDTRYLLSFGPFDIDPGQKLPISLAYIAGENFHTYRDNIYNLPDDPDAFYDSLHFEDLGTNSMWASWIYDNPGVDTDGDKYFGKCRFCVTDSTVIGSTMVIDTVTFDTTWEINYKSVDTIWYEGDGVPDFRGASPPPAPDFWIEPSVGSLHIRFNGTRSETTKDVFSRLIDFEGYRIYIARDERASSYSVVSSYDLEDYNKYVYDTVKGDFELAGIPYTLEVLRAIYGTPFGNPDFDPLAYSRTSPFVHPHYPDSIFYFEPQDFNQSQLGLPGGIRKVYPDQPYPSSVVPDSARPDELTEEGYLKYFEYEYEIHNLLPTVPYWVNVTAFDFGSPSSGLGSLESSVTLRAKSAYPLSSVDEVARQNLKVFVYPNPYRIDAGYRALGFEGRNTPGARPDDRVRAIHFANLPDSCTIRIFTLDGDLVREIKHEMDPSDPNASHDTWDLITRNTQMTVSGLYYWTVEAKNGETQIGKLVIIM